MKLAITATGKNLDAEIDPRFGRAQCILIVDPDGTIIDVIDNEPNRAAMGGAGIGAAKMLADRSVNVLLTGRCGPNAQAALDAAGIRIYEVPSGSARQALERFNRGELRVNSEPAAAGQPGAASVQGPAANRGMGMGRGMGGGRGMGRGRGRGGR